MEWVLRFLLSAVRLVFVQKYLRSVLSLDVINSGREM